MLQILLAGERQELIRILDSVSCQAVIAVDPDPHWESRSGSRRAKRAHKIEKSEEISCFELLDVLC
jgi:hypothetical protein